MSPSTITLLFLLFAVIMFVFEKNSAGSYFNDRLYWLGRNWGFRHQDGFCRLH